MAFGQNAEFGFILAPTTSVPEPAAWALMILGFAGVGVVAREGDRRPQQRVQPNV